MELETVTNSQPNMVLQWLRISAFRSASAMKSIKYIVPLAPLCYVSEFGFNPKAETHFHAARLSFSIPILCATWHLRDPLLFFLLLLL